MKENKLATENWLRLECLKLALAHADARDPVEAARVFLAFVLEQDGRAPAREPEA